MDDQNLLVKLDAVSKSYRDAARDRMVLSGVDAMIESGQFVAVHGRSGSGKSTLLNLIGGIDLPSDGEIWIDGQEITALSEHRRTLFRRRHIGFVFQFFHLIPTLTVTENLLLNLELNGIDRVAAKNRVRELLSNLGLLERRNTFPDQLSGGEQQRVAIARAVAHRPSLVLADEPTGNLDCETERDVLQLLRDMPVTHRAAVITATHSNDVAACADRVLYLQDGKLSDKPA